MRLYLYSLYLDVKYLQSFSKKKRHHRDFALIKKEYKKILRLGKLEMKGLSGEPRRKNEKVINLYNRLKKYESQILAFAKNFSIPFINNQIERDFRMSKIHLKISGCFRSEQMASHWSLMRSFISTLKKRGIPIFESIKY